MVRELRVQLFTNNDFLLTADPYFSFVNLNSNTNVRFSVTQTCAYTDKNPLLNNRGASTSLKGFMLCMG